MSVLTPVAKMVPVLCEYEDRSGGFILKTERSKKTQYGGTVWIAATPGKDGVKSVTVWKDGCGRAEIVVICDGRSPEEKSRPVMDVTFREVTEMVKEADPGTAGRTRALRMGSTLFLAAISDDRNDWPEGLLDAVNEVLGS